MLDVLCIGYACWDITASLNHYPEADEKTTAQSLSQEGGGPAYNASIAVARLGGRSAFAGCIGNDAHGRLQLEELQNEGVDHQATTVSSQPSSLSMIWTSPDGQRALVNHRPELPNLPPPTWSTPPKCILADGHAPSWTNDALNYFPDTPWILDAGSLHPGTEELIARHPTYLVTSRKFATAISGSDQPSDWLSCLGNYSSHVAVTMGPEGVIYGHQPECHHLPAERISVLDTNGAGDAFHGAFAYSIARNRSWKQSLQFAMQYATQSCTQRGGHGSYPDKHHFHCHTS